MKKTPAISTKDLQILTNIVSFVFAIEQARKEHKVTQKKSLQVLRKLYWEQVKRQKT